MTLLIDILFWSVLAFLAVRLLVSSSNLLGRPRLRAVGIPGGLSSSETDQHEAISVLIPARNEAENLPVLLESLARVENPKMEVIVLDDHSEDDTAEVVRKYWNRDPRIRLISGAALPKGWLGKNWACHQLALAAKGDYFLFLDADVEIQPTAPQIAIQNMKQEGLSLLSLFPGQQMKTLGERLVVPLMHYLLLTLLPLRLVKNASQASLAAANGQFMLFEANSYKKHKWHEGVKTCIVEDIEIMKRVKRAGLKGNVLLGNAFVECRMYKGYSEGLKGFSKNILAGFNESVAGLFIYLFLTLLAYPFFLTTGMWTELGILGGLILLLRGTESLAAGQNVLLNLLLHPLQMLSLLIISINSIYLKIRGKRQWKGRNIDLSTA